MSVIEKAEKRLQEEVRQNDLGADNGHLLSYWAAYLDGARAQHGEMMKTRNDELNAAYRQGYDAASEEQRKGEWVEENRRPRSSQFVCSECHRTAYDPQPTRDKAWKKRCRYAYCPNCGAKMMEVQDG